MYQGKFSNKGNKKKTEDSYDSQVQPNQRPSERTKRPASAHRPASVQQPVEAQHWEQEPSPEYPYNRPQPQAQRHEDPSSGYAPQQQFVPQFQQENRPPVRYKRNHTGAIIGGIFFYVILFLGIGLSLLGMKGKTNSLTVQLRNYEKLQPDAVSQQIFSQVFSSPNWAAIYDNTKVELNKFENKDAFVQFMNERVGAGPLTFQRGKDPEDGRLLYYILLNKDKVASFYLKNSSSNPQDPKWQLDGMEVYFQAEDSYHIFASSDHIVKVNGVQLDDRYLLQRTGMKLTEDLGDLSKNVKLPGTCLYEVSNLLVKPQVTIEDQNGLQMEVSYDEETCTFSETVAAVSAPVEAKNLALNAVKTYCEFMIKKATRADLSKYFNPETDTYKAITASDLTWIQKESGHSTANEKIKDYVQLNNDHFSIRVSLTWQLERKDGSIKESPVDVTLVFGKEESGKWRCQRMTGVDFVESFHTVRVRFMHEETVISSLLVSSSDKTIQCPTVGIPEGRKLAGWVTVMQDENGHDYYQRVLEPDESGLCKVPDGLFEKPLDLYPVHVKAK